MLYQIYETQRALTEPFAEFAKAASRVFSNPAYVFSETPLAQRISAAYDLMYRLGKDYEKPAFGITSVEVEGIPVAIQERVEIDKPFCELRRFKRYSDNLDVLESLLRQPVVLIVAPLSGHYATLLRETVRTMLGGHRVYITDWKNARNVPLSEGDFHLDDYVNYVQEFIRYIQQQYGNCHVMSVCQPTVPVLAAVSLMASRGEKTPLSMTMMGGPIDARKSPTSVNALAQSKSFEWFENNVIYRVPYGFAGEGRRVYPGFLQYAGFVAMNPDRHATSHYDYFRNLVKGDDGATEHHRKFYDEYNAVLDMDANYYLETIATVFQDFNLVHGTWTVTSPEGKKELVKPQDIKDTALITVEGELDDISGSGQTKAAHGLCKGIAQKDREHIEVKGAGHYGIFSGSRWRTQVYPQLRDFYLRFPVQGAETLDRDVLASRGIERNYIFNEDDAPEVLSKVVVKKPAAKKAVVRKTAAKKSPVKAEKIVAENPAAPLKPTAKSAVPKRPAGTKSAQAKSTSKASDVKPTVAVAIPVQEPAAAAAADFALTPTVPVQKPKTRLKKSIPVTEPVEADNPLVASVDSGIETALPKDAVSANSAGATEVSAAVLQDTGVLTSSPAAKVEVAAPVTSQAIVAPAPVVEIAATPSTAKLAAKEGSGEGEAA